MAGDREIEKIRQELEREIAKRISAEQKLAASETAFYNAIDQLREEKRKAETDSKVKAKELEAFGKFSDQSPYPTLRMNTAGELLYCNKKARELLRMTLKRQDHDMKEIFFYKVKMAIETGQTVTGNFNVWGTLYHLTFAPHHQGESVNVFAVDISEQERMRKYFEVLSSFSTSLLETHDKSAVAWLIAKQSIAALGYLDCVVYMKDPITGKFMQMAAHGEKNPTDQKILAPIYIELGQGIVGNVALNKRGEIVNDVTKDERYISELDTAGSEITVPIIVNDEVIGVIDSEHPKKNQYTEDDLNILTAIASAASSRLQRIEALENLRKEEEQFKSFVENAFGGLYILRGDSFEYVNQPFCEIIGYDEQEVVDPNFDFLGMIVASDENAVQAIKEREGGDTSPKSYKIEIRTKNGETRHLAVNTTILFDERGPYTLGISLDISMIEESRKQLNALNKELGKRNEELAQFAHLASHNLRAPVTNLMGLLEHYNRENPADETNEFIVDQFENSVQNLSSTLEEMHEVLKVRASKNDKFYKVNLNNTLDKVQSLIQEQIANSGAEINFDFDVNEIKYVKGHIENIMLNMLTNSIKYACPEKSPKIRIKAFYDDEFVKLVFEDNGQGINLERHGKDIFGMYKRFHNHPDSRGLGLYLIKTQLDSLGGNISVESEVGKGTAFTIALRTK